MELENDNEYETVIIEGEIWALPGPREDTAGVPEAAAVQSDDVEDGPATEALQNESAATQVAEAPDRALGPADSADQQTTDQTSEPDFDALEALTKLLVGGVIEGTSQLTSRLREYEIALREEAQARAAAADAADSATSEDELDRLRYALVGLIFDAQAAFRRNVTLWAKAADQSARVTNRVAQPMTNSFIFRPVRRRFDKLVKRGEESLARWVADGREREQPSRDLARMTYTEILDEFIDRLAENPELQDLITQQSIGMASVVRDEVRERTVSGDNLVEALVRRLLRRTPRAQLPSPPPEVQRWAGLTLDEYRAQMTSDERTDDSP